MICRYYDIGDDAVRVFCAKPRKRQNTAICGLFFFIGQVYVRSVKCAYTRSVCVSGTYGTKVWENEQKFPIKKGVTVKIDAELHEEVRQYLNEYPEGECDRIEFAASILRCSPADYGLYLNASEDVYIRLDTDTYDLIDLFDRPALFSNWRLSSDDIPKGLYCYDLREADNGDEFITIEPHVVVNHGGSVITDEPIEFMMYDHVRLRDTLFGIEGKFLLSYNDCEEVRRLYDGCRIFPFTRIHSMAQRYDAGRKSGELLIGNYDIFERGRAQPRQISMFA